MSVEIKVPVLPESVADAEVSVWHKQVGDKVNRDEVLVELETDKVMLEVPAPADGTLLDICHAVGDSVTSDEVLARIGEAAEAESSQTEQPQAEKQIAIGEPVANSTESEDMEGSTDLDLLSPSVRRLLHEHAIDHQSIKGTGKQGRITKQDVLQAIRNGDAAYQENNAALDQSTHAAEKATPQATSGDAHDLSKDVSDSVMSGRKDERVRMSRLRQRVAERLVDVQQTSAMLTTFNEVNMQAVMDLRKTYKEAFEKKHGVRLGFMSFFIKACVEALKRFPVVNASLDGQEMVYHHYVDIGVAVGGGKGGLVVPVLRNVEDMSMADIETQVRQYGKKAQEGQLTLDEMTGGTFTVTNGGVYGSMLSTPIINPPQSAILGMHNIVERPIAEKGQVVIRPVMYLALTYDHRIVDGKEAVSFLVTVKEFIEDPSRLLLAV